MSKINLLVLLLLGTFLWQCQQPEPVNPDSVAIIPQPTEIQTGNGYFTLSPKTAIVFNSKDEEVASVAAYLQEVLQPATGFTLDTRSSGRRNVIQLVIDKSIVGNLGVYKLQSSPAKVEISAPDATGLFYGVQTLRQLLPVEIEQPTVQSGISWDIPSVTVFDEPRFQYRGLHLDVARHFFPVSFIKKYIDLLAFHKMNKFHWHLTDDQGWRIEIKSYPLLGEIAAVRNGTLIGHGGRPPFEYDNIPYGGYYTHDEIREIVKYAEARYITVIPEIDFPGHTIGVLAAYPNLGCTGGPYEVAKRWGVFDDVLCAGNEEVFTFLENVFLEVMDLFPSEYIHVGGDECPKTRWKACPKCQARMKTENLHDEDELQSWFMHRIEKFLNNHDRKIIGWDEITEGGLSPTATVMYWRGWMKDVPYEVAEKGNFMIMTPSSHLYLDHYQNDPEEEPMAICCFSDLENVYSYEPIPEGFTPEQEKLVLGAQANLWTEYMKTSEHVEYMAYPRAVALAEVVWTDKSLKNYDDFVRRLMVHLKRLDGMNVNYFDKEFR